MTIALRLCVLFSVFVPHVVAQTPKPDFSGTWQLDVQRTRFGEIPPPKSLLIQIEHHDPQIRIVTITTTDDGETRETLVLTTDGQPHNYTLQDQPCSATARWDAWRGERLIAEVKRPGSLLSRRFSLGAKGKILTTVLTIKDNSGEKKAYEFFFKQ